jgi:hypothetical protein
MPCKDEGKRMKDELFFLDERFISREKEILRGWDIASP